MAGCGLPDNSTKPERSGLILGFSIQGQLKLPSFPVAEFCFIDVREEKSMSQSDCIQAGHPVDFADFLSFEEFRWFAVDMADRRGLPESRQQARRRLYQERVFSVMMPALQGFLTRLRDLGRLAPIPGAKGHSTHLLNDWNAMVARDRRYQEQEKNVWNTITRRFAFYLLSESCHLEELPQGDGTHAESDGNTARTTNAGAVASSTWQTADHDNAVDAACRLAYRHLVDSVNKGDIPYYMMSAEEFCFKTGETYSVEVKDWNIRIGKASKGRLTPIDDIDISPVIEGENRLRRGRADDRRLVPRRGFHQQDRRRQVGTVVDQLESWP